MIKNKYHIGFLYNSPEANRSYSCLLAYYTGACIQFKTFCRSLLPFKLSLSNMCYYSLDYPIIYQENEKGDVVMVKLMNEITNVNTFFIYNNEKSDFTLGEPNIKKHEVSLYLNDVDITEQFNLFEKNVIYYYSIKQITSYLEKESRCLDDHFCQHEFNILRTYLDNINLNEILQDLEVKVSDHYYNKLGGDDRYSIYRSAKASHPLIDSDYYLSTLLGIGDDICIYYDNGYTSNLRSFAEEFIQSHPIGIYAGEVLENEKQRIISNYSRELHLLYLVKRRFIEREYHILKLPIYKGEFESYHTYFIKEYNLSPLLNTDRKYEHIFYKGIFNENLNLINITTKELTHACKKEK